jgi:tRNA threonylcarbamoyladenosine biosynthesis protein TsaB
MALILNIETATPVCSIALFKGEELLALRETDVKNAHSQSIAVFIDEVFKEAGFQPDDLDAVAVSSGPGSYTGLRIGVSTAKGICYALNKPLISVGTLEAMAYGMAEACKENRIENCLFAPMIDARRMEVYTSLFAYDLSVKEEVSALVVDEKAFHVYIDDHASAVFMATVALHKFKNGNFENTAYFEPFYLKDFIAGKPSVKGLH